MATNATLPAARRVAYRNGILLDASDFQQEQQYHRRQLYLALRYLHGYGTVAGLRVEHKPAGAVDPATGEPDPAEQIVVQPGVALDRAGRLIEIPSSQCLRLERWFAFQREQPGAALKLFVPGGGERHFIADLFVRFRECPQGLRPGFPEPAADATDAVVPARTLDSFELHLVPRDCDPEDTLPPVPPSRFPTAPADSAAARAAIYAAYAPDPAADATGYPPGFADPTAVFLARIQLRLADAPATELDRHTGRQVIVDDASRPLAAPTDLLRHVLST